LFILLFGVLNMIGGVIDSIRSTSKDGGERRLTFNFDHEVEDYLKSHIHIALQQNQNYLPKLFNTDSSLNYEDLIAKVFDLNTNHNNIQDLDPLFLSNLTSSFEPLKAGTLGLSMLNWRNVTMIRNDSNLLFSRAAEVPLSYGIHLIVTFHVSDDYQDRSVELLSVLLSNLENPAITAIHLLWQGNDPLYQIPPQLSVSLIERGLLKKLILTEVKHQPTYKEQFLYANEKLRRGAIVIITNADIYFDSSISCVGVLPVEFVKFDHFYRNETSRVALSLSRRKGGFCESKPEHSFITRKGKGRRRKSMNVTLFDLCANYTKSHDMFVFTPPIPKSVIDNTDHPQNLGYGAENMVIDTLQQAGFVVLNPCETVQGYHLHCSGHRSYHPSVVKKFQQHLAISPPIGSMKCNNIWVY
jgi:hypothetical protein